eukprot:SAG31_NODE_1691_length_7513_cov_11.746830_7_plen_101_part_00
MLQTTLATCSMGSRRQATASAIKFSNSARLFEQELQCPPCHVRAADKQTWASAKGIIIMETLRLTYQRQSNENWIGPALVLGVFSFPVGAGLQSSAAGLF